MTFVQFLSQIGIDFIHNIITFAVPVGGAFYIALRVANRRKAEQDELQEYRRMKKTAGGQQ